MSPAQNIVFEGLLSQEECCSAALQGMANGRTPGFDGLPMEFYLRFWSVLRADLALVLNSAFASGLMHVSLSESWSLHSLLRTATVYIDPIIGYPAPC